MLTTASSSRAHRRLVPDDRNGDGHGLRPGGVAGDPVGSGMAWRGRPGAGTPGAATGSVNRRRHYGSAASRAARPALRPRRTPAARAAHRQCEEMQARRAPPGFEQVGQRAVSRVRRAIERQLQRARRCAARWRARFDPRAHQVADQRGGGLGREPRRAVYAPGHRALEAQRQHRSASAAADRQDRRSPVDESPATDITLGNRKGFTAMLASSASTTDPCSRNDRGPDRIGGGHAQRKWPDSSRASEPRSPSAITRLSRSEKSSSKPAPGKPPSADRPASGGAGRSADQRHRGVEGLPRPSCRVRSSRRTRRRSCSRRSDHARRLAGQAGPRHRRGCDAARRRCRARGRGAVVATQRTAGSVADAAEFSGHCRHLAVQGRRDGPAAPGRSATRRRTRYTQERPNSAGPRRPSAKRNAPHAVARIGAARRAPEGSGVAATAELAGGPNVEAG